VVAQEGAPREQCCAGNRVVRGFQATARNLIGTSMIAVNGGELIGRSQLPVMAPVHLKQLPRGSTIKGNQGRGGNSLCRGMGKLQKYVLKRIVGTRGQPGKQQRVFVVLLNQKAHLSQAIHKYLNLQELSVISQFESSVMTSTCRTKKSVAFPIASYQGETTVCL
jgi:hypothetical protein